MITSFDLKHKGVCRFFIRTPYYFKQIVLLVIMSFVLALVYFFYFRKDGMVFQLYRDRVELKCSRDDKAIEQLAELNRFSAVHG